MRLTRGVPVAGVEPETARSLAKACHGTWRHEAYVAHRASLDVPSARALLLDLEAAGYFERRESVFDEVLVEWQTTIAGAALAMASFLKPITRARAETLLEGVLTRAEAYNADKRKLFKIGRIQVFGSYLNPSVSHLGDLDLNVEVVGRRAIRHLTSFSITARRQASTSRPIWTG